MNDPHDAATRAHYAQLISLALDGALSPSQQRELDAHLAQCPDCRALKADLTALQDSLAHLPELTPPPELHDRILSRLAQENTTPFPAQAPTEKRAPRRKGWASVAAAALVALSAWGVSRSGQLPGVFSADAGNETALEVQALTEEDTPDLADAGITTGSAEETVTPRYVAVDEADFSPENAEAETREASTPAYDPTAATQAQETSAEDDDFAPFIAAVNYAAEALYGGDRRETARSYDYDELTCTLTVQTADGEKCSGSFTYLSQSDGTQLVRFTGFLTPEGPQVEREITFPQTLVK